MYEYIGKDGKLYKIGDYYEEAIDLQNIISQGTKAQGRVAKARLKELDKDFKWSIRDAETGAENLGKEGFSNREWDGKTTPKLYKGETIVSQGDTGVTVRNEKGFDRYITINPNVTEAQTATLQAEGYDTGEEEAMAEQTGDYSYLEAHLKAKEDKERKDKQTLLLVYVVLEKEEQPNNRLKTLRLRVLVIQIVKKNVKRY